MAVLAGCAAMLLPGSAAVGAERPMKVYVLGDSLTAGYGVGEQDSLPSQLQTALRARGHAVDVLNGGVSGDTTAGGLARLGWALKDKPDAVIIALGGNDALRGIDPRSMKGNLDAILRRLAGKGIPALIAGFKAPRNLGDDYAQAFDAVFPDLARTHRVLFYPFILEGVALVPEFNQGDGIHPNAQGVAVMVRSILPLAEALLRRTGKTAPPVRSQGR